MTLITYPSISCQGGTAPQSTSKHFYKETIMELLVKALRAAADLVEKYPRGTKYHLFATVAVMIGLYIGAGCFVVPSGATAATLSYLTMKLALVIVVLFMCPWFLLMHYYIDGPKD